MWKFKEGFESLYDKEDEMTEEEIAALEKMNFFHQIFKILMLFVL
jgi:hypothetical protein